MKTYSRVLSMFLVVVMCFGLFSMSAYATGFDFGGEGSSAPAAPAESGFEFNPGYDYGSSVAEKPANDDSFSLNIPENTVEFQEPKQEEKPAVTEGFQFEDTATFNTPYSEMGTNPEFEVSPVDVSKTDPVDVVITLKTGSGKMDGDTFPAGLAYSTSPTGADLVAMTAGVAYKMESGKLTLLKTWLKSLPAGTYYFYGRRYENVPVKLGFINVNAGDPSDYGTFRINNTPYDKNDPTVKLINVEALDAKGRDTLAKMDGFGVANASGSYAHPLTVNEYDRPSTGYPVTLAERYLDSLPDGEYYLIGFPTVGSTRDQINLGKFIVKSADHPISGPETLTPDGQVWYSGTDPLVYFSTVYEKAGLNWNYAGVGYDVIIPDIRYSTRADMIGATSVRIDQYWDLGYGYFMLGQNFLSSLSAEHTYYLQVVDARHPNLLYSNVVSFRVGPTLRALDTDKHVINSTRSLRFRSSAPISRVYVGNIELTDPADFGVSWDGQTVTLSYEFLNKRSAGNTYTIKVLTTTGEYAATTFQVLTTAQGSASPRTGDESNLGLWAAFLLLSGTAIVVMVPKLRKHEM